MAAAKQLNIWQRDIYTVTLSDTEYDHVMALMNRGLAAVERNGTPEMALVYQNAIQVFRESSRVKTIGGAPLD